MLLSYLHSESSRWRTERMLLWLTRYTSRCFSFPLVLFLFPVPDFCNLTTSPPTSPLHPPSSPPHSFESIPKLYNQECTCVCVCVSFREGSTQGCCHHPSTGKHPDGWLGVESVEVLLAATWEKVLIHSVFGLKPVNIVIEKFQVSLQGSGSQVL